MKDRKKYFRSLVIIATLFIILISVLTINNLLSDLGPNLASVILSHNFKTVAEIKSNYESAGRNSSKDKVRILIVPGHEPNFGGAEFGGLKERDITADLSQSLKKLLESNTRYEVFVTRDKKDWSPNFAHYFDQNWQDIIEWKKASHKEFSHLISVGSVTQDYSSIIHNNAPENVAVRLYGITKWSNENDIDIVIHVHFNDHPRNNMRGAGKYSGFAVYVPASQYGNSKTTKAIADDIFKRLEKYNPVSDHPGESVGIIDEPELIAVGVNNTSDAASILIEYSYIYESQIQDPELRGLFIEDLAFQTYLGLQDFFDPTENSELTELRGTIILPADLSKLSNSEAGKPVAKKDIFALQTALIIDGAYPPPDKNKNDCPRTGIFGPCTRASLEILKGKNLAK